MIDVIDVADAIVAMIEAAQAIDPDPPLPDTFTASREWHADPPLSTLGNAKLFLVPATVEDVVETHGGYAMSEVGVTLCFMKKVPDKTKATCDPLHRLVMQIKAYLFSQKTAGNAALQNTTHMPVFVEQLKNPSVFSAKFTAIYKGM